MEKFEIKFKHKRTGFIQSVFGSLDEDASFIAEEATASKLEELFEELTEASKNKDDFCETMALEMCIEKATTNEELVIFIYEIAKAQRCPNHGLIQMMMGQGKK